MPLPKEQIYTIDDIYALPDTLRAELIDGRIYYMAPPSRKHQRIVLSLSRKIADYIDAKGGSCEVNISPFGVFLNENDSTYLEPDISVVCDPNKLSDRGCEGAPDWIIEIVSPGSRQHDYLTKLFLYRPAGVLEYWLVDPDKNRITVYDFAKNEQNEYSFTDVVPVGIYSDFSIDFGQVRF
ncbi:MAG: Uma2 family endonuclease [Lachnospiraceae bacterium]|nr:Uma2 family endonuclease [Lachnospiraceae bacterium]